MPLPKISTPTYELELPSTKKTIQYRPFLVREEKLLVLALESEDTKQITTAIKTVLSNCIETPGIKVENLPTFDIEYLFLNIRGKSVGEEVEVNLIAPHDGVTEVAVTVPLDEIVVVENPEHSKQIKLSDDMMMESRKKTGTKLCARGKASAKSKYDVYPSAYANGHAIQVCKGKIKGLDGKKKCSPPYC